jgi:hypothetical protein
METRQKVFSGKYTHIVIFPRTSNVNGKHRRWYVIRINDVELPREIDNARFMNNGITMFEFTGTLFIGGKDKFELTIFETSNGVTQAEVTVIEGG